MFRFSLRTWSAVCAGLLALATAAPTMQAQSQTTNPYPTYDQMTSALQALVSQHSARASLTSLTKTDAGRDMWLLTLANKQGPDPQIRPALLIVATLEANHLIGGATAFATAEHLLTSYGTNAEVT